MPQLFTPVQQISVPTRAALQRRATTNGARKARTGLTLQPAERSCPGPVRLQHVHAGRADVTYYGQWARSNAIWAIFGCGRGVVCVDDIMNFLPRVKAIAPFLLLLFTLLRRYGRGDVGDAPLAFLCRRRPPLRPHAKAKFKLRRTARQQSGRLV